jgi:hypothetical protein
MDVDGRHLRRAISRFWRRGGIVAAPAPANGGHRPALEIESARMMSRAAAWLRLSLLALALFGFHASATAAVEVAFYSRELGGNNFPHAFVALRGTVDSTGEAVDTTYGFTAKAVTPALLFGSVSGEVVVEREGQIARSDRQFSITLSDEGYAALMAVVERWRSAPQPSYNLNRRNCVHFVADLAEAAGLRVERVERLMKRPRSFLLHVRELNPSLSAPVEVAAPATEVAGAH